MAKQAGISFRGKSFWVLDSIGGVFLYYLVQQTRDSYSGKLPSWLDSQIGIWLLASAITSQAAYADDEWTNEQIDIVVNLSKKAIKKIRAHGDFTKAEIEAWHLDDSGLKQFSRYPIIPNEDVAKFGEAYIALLRNELPRPPSKKWWFYGVGLTPGTIDMAVDYDYKFKS